MVDVKPLTQKGINSITNTGYLNVWEGAVRSGKTVAANLAFIYYVCNSPENYFIMSGKTIATLYRNVIGGDFGMVSILGPLGDYYTDREGNRILEIHAESGSKKIYCFGANDERSYSRLRGLTAGGWYADEVNLHPQSFIEEAFRRTIVSTDRKHYWTLNPDNPFHWIYTDYVDKYLEEELPGFYLWHFTLEDNLAMPPERKEELKRQYSGLFYRRYILGERCVAEGIIYDMFTDDNLYDDEDRPFQLELRASHTVACDYGTTNPFVLLSIWDDGETIWVDDEYRWDSKIELKTKSDAEYVKALDAFVDGDRKFDLIIDPSAASYRVACKQSEFYVVKEVDNDVENGIRRCANLIGQRKVRFHKKRCAEAIKELRNYTWDEKAAVHGDEKPVKDKDHAPDAFRYFVNTNVSKWRLGENGN